MMRAATVLLLITYKGGGNHAPRPIRKGFLSASTLGCMIPHKRVQDGELEREHVQQEGGRGSGERRTTLRVLMHVCTHAWTHDTTEKIT